MSIVTTSATPTAVVWVVHDHWRDAPDRFETTVYWLLTLRKQKCAWGHVR